MDPSTVDPATSLPSTRSVAGVAPNPVIESPAPGSNDPASVRAVRFLIVSLILLGVVGFLMGFVVGWVRPCPTYHP